MKRTLLFVTSLCLIVSTTTTAAPLGTTFTYQGRLSEGGSLANGSYDVRFTLYNAETGGTSAGGPPTNSAVAVSDGGFSTALDSGAIDTGESARVTRGPRGARPVASFGPSPISATGKPRWTRRYPAKGRCRTGL